MNIHIDEFALQQEIAALYLESEKSSQFIDSLITVSNFVRDAEPTRSNIAVAEQMIQTLNINLGGKVIRFEGGIYGQDVANLDAESIRETGTRIWRAIVDIVRRIVTILRNMWKRFFGSDEEVSRKQKSAADTMEEQYDRAVKTHKDLNLGRRESLGQEMKQMLDDLQGAVFVDGGRRTSILHPEDVRNNILLTINLADMSKNVALFSLVGKQPISSVIPLIKSHIENIETIKSLGSNTDLFTFCRKITAITTERDFLEVVNGLSSTGLRYQESAKDIFEAAKRKNGSKNGIPIGNRVIQMSFSKVTVGKHGDIPYTTASTQVGLTGLTGSRLNGGFSFEDVYALLDLRAELASVRQAVEQIAEEYNAELEYFTGDGRGEILKDATQRIGELEVSPAIKDKLPAIQQLPKDIHNILLREQKIFDQTVQATADLTKLVDVAANYIMTNATMYDGALAKGANRNNQDNDE